MLRAKARDAFRHPLLGPTLASTGSTAATSLLGYLAWVILARNLHATQVGEGSTLIALATTTAILTAAGAGTALLLYLPGKTRAAQVGAITAVVGVTSALAGFLAAGVGAVLATTVPTYRFLADPVILLLTGGTGATIAAGFVADAAVVAAHRAGILPLRNITQSLLKLLTIPTLLALHLPGALIISLTWVVTASISLILATRVFAGSWSLGVHHREALSALREGFGHHHLSTAAAAIPGMLLPLFVTARLGTTQSAYLSLSWLIASMFFMVSPAVSTALIASTAAARADLAHRLRTARLLITALLAPTTVFAALAAPLILALFGPGYADAGSGVLRWFALAAWIDAHVNLATATARVHRRLRVVTVASLTRAGFTLAVTWFMLPTWGLAAAGIGWLIGQVAATLMLALARPTAAADTSTDATIVPFPHPESSEPLRDAA